MHTKKLATSNQECPRFKTCAAPLCPLNPEIDQHTWYPDEEICRRNGFTGRYRWIRVQKKIQKRARCRNRYFTKEMLESVFAVLSGTKGVNPDTDDYRQAEERWLARRGDLEPKIQRARKRRLPPLCTARCEH